MRLYFLIKDPTAQYETGEPKEWVNKLKIICPKEEIQRDSRIIELRVLPRGEVRYSLDGSNPREGKKIDGPLEIGLDNIRVLAFAKADELEAQEEFKFSAHTGLKEPTSIKIDPQLSYVLEKTLRLSGAEVWKAVQSAKALEAKFFDVVGQAGEGQKYASIRFSPDFETDPSILEKSLVILQSPPLEPSAPLTLQVRKMQFRTGHDLEQFARDLEFSLKAEEVKQL